MLSIQNFNVTIDGRHILHNINYTQQLTGKLIGVLGPNGAGKSTLFKGILGFIRASGDVRLDNKPLIKQLTRCAYIPQKSSLDIEFPITVIDTISSGLYPVSLIKQRSDNPKVHELMSLMELNDIQHKLISELSGGQLQRVLIARSLMQDKDIYFLDEPFVGIDFKSYEIIKDCIFKLKSNHKLIFIVHHDLNSASDLFDECILLNKEIIAEGTTKSILTDNNIKQTYFVQGGI
ncbi:metal ABC transporter ATP-binding protein [Macrococcoides canis]|uniref:metal ABC transporter ATP-binding protein n=1 Tax=Macrococcoides canis TaxID=1855823 RepID=UPI00105F6BEF|nr:metal ABC transporter ATP-binding protein [Macrococcus canis]MEE1106845.1 metal ABC transporter ATP-binding protein [Macrococcus canis]TDM30828.1 metal ABC transporter ATP-binding protein [Macrococcus canis]